MNCKRLKASFSLAIPWINTLFTSHLQSSKCCNFSPLESMEFFNQATYLIVSLTSSNVFLAVAAKSSHSYVFVEISPVRSSSYLLRLFVAISQFLSNSDRLVAESFLKASRRSRALSISYPSSSFCATAETRSIAKAAKSNDYLILISVCIVFDKQIFIE